MNVGDAAPEITATTTQGHSFTLSKLRGRYVVIYFFPKAFTPGCTQETKQFRDHYPELAAVGAEVVGISTDDDSVQCDFASTLKVPFPMLGDPKNQIVTSYGAKWPVFNLAQRVTVIVDPAGKLAATFHHELQVSQHVNDVLGFFAQLPKA